MHQSMSVKKSKGGCHGVLTGLLSTIKKILSLERDVCGRTSYKN